MIETMLASTGCYSDQYLRRIRSLLAAVQHQFPITFCINFLSKGSYRSDWHQSFDHELNVELVAPAYPNGRYPKASSKRVQWYAVQEIARDGLHHYHGQVMLPPLNALGRDINTHSLHPAKKRIERIAKKHWCGSANLYLEPTRELDRCVSYNLKHLTPQTDCIWQYINLDAAALQALFSPC